MHDKSLTFVTAADEGFHHGLEPLFKSFLLANRQFAPLRLLLMDCGLPDGYPGQLKQTLTDFGNRRGISLVFQSIRADLQRWHVFPPHWDSYATYAFLEAPPLADTRYLVFADADMLHFTNLETAIQSLDASGHSLAAVQDGPATLASDYYVGLLNPEARPEAPYLNGGYLIFDLKRFDYPDFLRFTDQLDPATTHQRHPGKKKFKHDQTLLNSYLAGKFLLLEPRYNYLAKHNRQLAGLRQPANIHFVSNPKPWETPTHDSLLRAVSFHSAIAAQEDPEQERIQPVIGHWTQQLTRLKPGLHRPLQTTLWKLLGKQKKVQRLDDAKLDANDIDQLVRQVYSWST